MTVDRSILVARIARIRDELRRLGRLQGLGLDAFLGSTLGIEGGAVSRAIADGRLRSSRRRPATRTRPRPKAMKAKHDDAPHELGAMPWRPEGIAAALLSAADAVK
jgi:hypothetical protein